MRNPPDVKSEGFFVKGSRVIAIPTGVDHSDYVRAHASEADMRFDDEDNVIRLMIDKGWVRIRFWTFQRGTQISAQGSKRKDVRDAIEWLISIKGIPDWLSYEWPGTFREIKGEEEIQDFLDGGYRRNPGERREDSMNNPPWTKKLYEKYDKRIRAVCEELKLPPPVGTELGCGHYGCVMATTREDIVFKITTDITEAQFVSLYFFLKANRNVDPYGIVKYLSIFAVPDEQYRKRPVFFLWREAADYVGQSMHKWKDAPERKDLTEEQRKNDYDYNMRNERNFDGYLLRAKQIAHTAREIAVAVFKKNPPHLYYAWIAEQKQAMDDTMIDQFDEFFNNMPRQSMHDATLSIINRTKNVSRKFAFAWLMSAFYRTTQEMTSDPFSYKVGEALSEYFDNDVMMADVHLGNVGFPLEQTRGGDYDSKAPIITDPGHVMVLSEALANEIRIPTLP